MCSVWTWLGVHWTKQHLNRCCPNLRMYLKNRVTPPAAHAYNIRLISLMMLSSLPATTIVIECPSLSWMSLKSRLIACWKKGGLPHPLLPTGTVCCLPTKKMAVCDYAVDFRSLNANTRLDRYPLPRIDKLLDRLNGHCILSSLDL